MDFTRDELRALHARSKVIGAAIFLVDYLVYALAIAGVIWFDFLPLRILGSLIATRAATGSLFVVGHDACHQSLTPSRWLNRLIGTLSFLPSLTPYSLWDLSHNRIHHRWVNQIAAAGIMRGSRCTFEKFQEISPVGEAMVLILSHAGSAIFGTT